MKIYAVGGQVRDKLMGVIPKDKDYVVVGSSPEEMLSLGYTQVGAAFPVFLHPTTSDEYALARTEKKNGVGYQGFDCYFGPEVTLTEDLIRRDLTINSMAIDVLEDGTEKLIDPFGGERDIKRKVLRATSSAFKEDPLRSLRTARFLSRFGKGWSIEANTVDMMDQIIPELVSNVSRERVWVETEKALSSKEPFMYLQTLLRIFMGCGLQEVANLNTKPIDLTVKYKLPLEQIWAVFCSNFNLDSIEELNKELKAPNSFYKEAMLLKKVLKVMATTNESNLASSTLEILKLTKYQHNPKTFLKVMREVHCICDACDVTLDLMDIGDKINSLDFKEITKGLTGSEIKDKITKEQLRIIKREMGCQN